MTAAPPSPDRPSRRPQPLGAQRGSARAWARGAALALLVLLALPFALHAARFGVSGLLTDLSGESYLYTSGDWRPNLSLSLHMLAGAVVTVLAPLQLIPAIRRRHPAVHRASGYAVASLALVTGIGGLAFIALRGTIGGPPMDAGFAGYGILLLVAAARVVQHARARDLARHRAWALRLFVLAIGSWLYRLHYVLWHALTGGAWSEPDFTGAFDRAQMVAFYLPYLLAVEIHLWTRRPRVPHEPAPPGLG